MLITISRQFGAGGSIVAKKVADALGWSVVDNELVDEVARRIGKPAEEVAQLEERAPSFGERLARALAASPDTPLVIPGAIENLDEPSLVRITENVVAELARQDRVVLVGRAAVAVLARDPSALHTRVVAPKAFRIREIMARLGTDEKDAEKAINDIDARRARYHKEYYQRDWSDPANYHMVLNTDFLGFAGASELIVARARSLGW